MTKQQQHTPERPKHCHDCARWASENVRLEAANARLREALEDAEFLMRKLAINPNEISAMKDSLVRSAESARAALEGDTK